MVASERRNPILADLFARMSFMERRGSGLKKITDRTNKLFNDGKNHVEFCSDDGFFQVTIFNANYGVEIESDNLQKQNSTVNSTVKLSKTQRAIIELVTQDNSITIEKMAEKLVKEISTIKKAIKKLRDIKIIERVGSDKTGYWKVN